MSIPRRFRWAIGLGSLKILAATVLFVYSKHKAASPPAPVPVSLRARVANAIPGKDLGAHTPKPESVSVPRSAAP